MKIVADTNLLVRIAVGDSVEQTKLAKDAMARADLVIVSNQALCEMEWVLRSTYRLKRPEIATMVERIRDSENVELDRMAVDAGLAAMGERADFADGVIAYEGRIAGGEVFVSFDKKAVDALTKLGANSRLLKSH